MTTLDYYNQNAASFADNTAHVDFKSVQDRFLSYLKPGSSILDFGCGSGRDSKYFLEKGFQVEATDGSQELAKLASEYAGIPVRCQLFQELEEVGKYDGIWACSSILHVPKKELAEVILRMERALTATGVIYTSFKYGNFEGERNGRYFSDFTLEDFKEFLKESGRERLQIEEYWITGDVRPGRQEEKWLNLIIRRMDGEYI